MTEGLTSRELTFLWVPGQQIGYGRVGVYLADYLKRRGVMVWNDDGCPTSTLGEGRFPRATPPNLVCWVSVPTHAKGWYDGQHRAIFTMWESSRLPEAFRDTIHEFQTILVPSYQNLELFSRYHDNVELVLLGVDPDLWHYEKVPPLGQTFDFLISGRGSRKGVDLAFEAFQRVFGQWWTYDDDNQPLYKGSLDRPAPRLIMKSLKGHGDYYAPGITHVTGKLEVQAEVDLYKRCHVYVQPSRGEGFGLQPLQAMALGRPTILTAAHGHESFANLGIGLSTTMSEADYFLHGDAGEWWEPNFEELCEAMWDTYQDYEPHRQAAMLAAQVIREHWTWDQTADRFLEVLGPEMEKPYTGSGEWMGTTRQLFPIITNEDHLSDAAGTRRFFKKGELYYDLAEIKRILFDAGKLAPECIEDDDPGLMPEQVNTIDLYRATHEHCPTCGQELNTRPTLADKIYAELSDQ